ncbi:lyase family protein [Salinibacterium hongtaonis]|uniref:lyase family protein n=1 Tax=Homoserinimonas hongtaonis TaxID=2079791 RepID=UPI000D350CE7|nr:lyase family protein [Salinibacterium hongtaonis]AWB88833.1 3-carboxy-cis,cis-muconate cycloisomerase [Salinibacterium hongtaonis]
MTNGSDVADVGLLSPQWAGTPVAAATSDAAIVAAMLDVEVALAYAWQELGFAPDGTGALIARVVDSLDIDVASLAARSRSGGNPIIPLVKDLRAAVAAEDAAAAVWVHRGATSQDIHDSALMLVAQRALVAARSDLASVVDSLSSLADSHRATLMVSRTLTQHGVPSTFGLKAAGWLAGVAHASVALDRAVAELPLQWGGAGGTLASYSVIGETGTGLAVSDAVADRLGLARSIPWQTQRSAVVQLASALAQVGGALGKIAVDVLVMVRPEFGELGEPSAAGRGGSSAMPQKQNPVLSVLIHSAARQAPGLAAEVQRSALAVDERPDGAWHAEWQAIRELLRLVGGAAGLAAELTSGLSVFPTAMLRNLGMSGSLVVSERLMLEYGPLVGRDRLQELVTAQAVDPTVDLGALLRAEPSLANVSDQSLADSLDPAQYVGDNDLIIDRAIESARSALRKEQ